MSVRVFEGDVGRGRRQRRAFKAIDTSAWLLRIIEVDLLSLFGLPGGCMLSGPNHSSGCQFSSRQEQRPECAVALLDARLGFSL